MNPLYVTVTTTTALLVIAVSIPDYIPAHFVLETSGAVRVPPHWLPRLATLKIAGALGLLCGIAGSHIPDPAISDAAYAIAIAAGMGLSLFFCGAIIFHVRARVLNNIWFPAMYLVLAIASAVLTAVH